MTIKKIKLIGTISSAVIGAVLVGIYIFSIVGINSLISYHIDAIEKGLGWSPSISREEKLSVLEICAILSYIIVGFAFLLKITSLILLKKSKHEKRLAIVLIIIKSISIILKVAGIIVTIPAVMYLGYTNTTMLVQFIVKIAFILAQASVLALSVIFLIKLKKESDEDNLEDNLEEKIIEVVE